MTLPVIHDLYNYRSKDKADRQQQDGFHPPADAWRVRIFGSARIQRFALVQDAVCQHGCF